MLSTASKTPESNTHQTTTAGGLRLRSTMRRRGQNLSFPRNKPFDFTARNTEISMVISKRQYTYNYRRKEILLSEEKEKRKKVVGSLRDNPSQNKTALATRVDISRRQVQRIAKALSDDDKIGLDKLLNVRHHRCYQSTKNL